MAIGKLGQSESKLYLGKGAAVEATGGNIAATSLATYSFTNYMRRVYVWNHPNSGANLYVAFNSINAGTTAWDGVLQPGDPPLVAPDGLLINLVAIYSSGEVIYKTDFVVKGWQ